MVIFCDGTDLFIFVFFLETSFWLQLHEYYLCIIQSSYVELSI